MKRKFHLKFVYTSHDTFSHGFEKSNQKAFIKLMKIADTIIVHTDKSANIIKTLNFNRVEVINHGLLDIRTIYPSKAIDFNKNEKIIFSLLGNMEEYKGSDLLIKAWLSSEKLTNNKKIYLVVIGRNNMNFHPIIPSNVNIIFKDTLLDDCTFTKWMEISDVIIMPYQEISQSGLLLTALSMNKHLIVNDVGELAIPVKKYKLGWVMNEKDVKGLKIKLETIISEIEINGLKPISNTILEKIKDDYSWIVSGKKTMKIYRKLLDFS